MKRRGVEFYSPNFLRFWEAYPRKEAKGAAWKAWKRLQPPLDALLTALAWQRSSAAWTKDGGEFIPLPATYLNATRWEDEPGTPAKPPAPDPRCDWHRDVRNDARPSKFPRAGCPRCKHLGARAAGRESEPTPIAALMRPEDLERRAAVIDQLRRERTAQQEAKGGGP